MYAAEQGLSDVEPDLRVLAGQVDRATYAAWPRPTSTPTRPGECSDQVVAELRRTRTTSQRLLMQLDPRPLRRDQASAGAREKVDA